MLRIEPQWILDALGLMEFNSDGDHQGPFVRDDGRLEIRTRFLSGGDPMTRRTVIDPKHGWIVQQSLYANGNLVAYVDSLNHEYIAEHNVSLPRHIEIHVFSQGQESLKLVLDTTPYRVNALHVDPQKTWTMPTPADVPIVDITRLSIQNSATN